ncbi:glycosyltransferase family 4 protein [Sodalinema gerasimenkoae]|uniref:glycosyltransferase family 4 protein n=1 Tax=Sodalinema gerasimenkoae TaxID=2862348 RepID=UPI00135C8A00|nr:glycosyltransferase family 4 protein [Sodalinema gerasimenkoae]
MKIAYLTEFNLTQFNPQTLPRNKLGHGQKCRAIFDALNHHHSVISVHHLNKQREHSALLPKLKRRYHKLFQKTYLPWTEPQFTRDYGQQLQTECDRLNPDIILTSDSNLIAYLNLNQPIALWTDTSYAGLIDHYPGYQNLCSASRRQLYDLDKRAYQRCRGLFFASQWAADIAGEAYQLPSDKINVIPFGANLSQVPTSAQVEAWRRSRPKQPCKLLFIGVDWQRKGGDMALAVAQELNQRGYPTELTLVGCQPPHPVPSFVQSLGFLNRQQPQDAATLDRLLGESHFLILPSRAECYGHVLCEANAFGVPVLTSDVGGIPTVVRQGVNGQRFPLDATAADYCNWIERLLQEGGYQDLAQTARQEFEQRLNWQVGAATLAHQLEGWV